MTKWKKGSFAQYGHNKLNIVKICGQNKDNVNVEFFYSIADRKTREVPEKTLKRVDLPYQMRCYAYIEDEEIWKIGRIANKDRTQYEVLFPNMEGGYIDEKNIYVRCASPIEDPTEVLIQKGHETAFFNGRRELFLNELINQRKVSRGMPGLISSKVYLYPHQVEIVRRVLQDPIQRYILADEVGLGKTIEAGIILRQNYLDKNHSKVLIIAPSFLTYQWENELYRKFSVYDFPNPPIIRGFDFLETKENNLDFDFVILDEAHHIAGKAFSDDPKQKELYDKFKKIAHNAEKLFLLSATPILNNEEGFLGMLHLIDPSNYNLDDIEKLKKLVKERQEVGRLLLAMRRGLPDFLLKKHAETLNNMFHDDPFIDEYLGDLFRAMEENKRNQIDDIVDKIRSHVTETYRLHRRLLRTRRDNIDDTIIINRGPEGKKDELIKKEFDLDDNTVEINILLEDYREKIGFGDKGNNSYEEIFWTLFEASGSWLGLFKKLIEFRLSRTEPGFLEEEYSQEKLEKVRNTPFFLGERELLESIIKILEMPQDEPDRINLLEDIIKKEINIWKKKKGMLPKVVVFSSYSSTCGEIEKALKKKFGKKAISLYSQRKDKDEIEIAVENFFHEEHCFILVCDKTGEEGRNLQFADILVHFDIPWSPNRIEQRIGRMDRIGREDLLKSIALVGPYCDNSLYEAWFNVLEKGFKVFNSSIASYQFFVENKMLEIKSKAIKYGAVGLNEMINEIIEDLEEEKIKIEEQHSLDEIDVLERNPREFFENFIDHDEDFTNIQKRLEPWIHQALLFERENCEDRGKIFYYRPLQRTLVPTPVLETLNLTLQDPLTYQRDYAVESENAKILRIGDFFIDVLSSYISWDDRGQTFAFWRKENKWSPKKENEWIGFKLNFIIEMDVSHAEKVIEELDLSLGSRHSIKRRGDGFLPPEFRSVFYGKDGEKVYDENLLRILTRPFRKIEDGGTDTNLTKERLGIFNQIIDPDSWEKICKEVREKANEEIREDPSFVAKLEKHYTRAQKDLELRIEQLKIRQKKIVKTKEKAQDLKVEEAIRDAVLLGIEKPRIKLDSIGLMVVAGYDYRELMNRND